MRESHLKRRSDADAAIVQEHNRFTVIKVFPQYTGLNSPHHHNDRIFINYSTACVSDILYGALTIPRD